MKTQGFGFDLLTTRPASNSGLHRISTYLDTVMDRRRMTAQYHQDQDHAFASFAASEQAMRSRQGLPMPEQRDQINQARTNLAQGTQRLDE